MLISLQSLSKLHQQKPNKVLFKEFSKETTVKDFESWQENLKI